MTFSRLVPSPMDKELTYSEVAKATTSSTADSMRSTQSMVTVSSNTFMAMKVMIPCTEVTSLAMNFSGEEKETTPSTEVQKPLGRFSTATKETTSYTLAQIIMVL